MDEWTYKEMVGLNGRIDSLEAAVAELIEQLEKNKVIEVKK